MSKGVALAGTVMARVEGKWLVGYLETTPDGALLELGRVRHVWVQDMPAGKDLFMNLMVEVATDLVGAWTKGPVYVTPGRR